MKISVFVLFSILYVITCAATDGVINRLTFREHVDEPYTSSWKKKIYKRSEWTFIGILLLILIGFLYPSIASFAIGGIKYVFIFLAIFSFVSWDIIFGKIVFNNWLGDSPSIKLPGIGWIQVTLKKSLILRAIFGVLFSVAALLI